MNYELKCIGIQTTVTCHPYIFQIIKFNGLTKKHIDYFLMFSDLSGIAPLPNKFFKIETMKIIGEVIELNGLSIPKLIRKFNKENKIFNQLNALRSKTILTDFQKQKIYSVIN